MFPAEFKFVGDRAIFFSEFDVVPVDSLTFCIGAALTYHRKKARACGKH